MLDKQALLAWLRDRSYTHESAVVGSVYEGLAVRVERGDFDVREEE